MRSHLDPVHHSCRWNVDVGGSCQTRAVPNVVVRVCRSIPINDHCISRALFVFHIKSAVVGLQIRMRPCIGVGAQNGHGPPTGSIKGLKLNLPRARFHHHHRFITRGRIFHNKVANVTRNCGSALLTSPRASIPNPILGRGRHGLFIVDHERCRRRCRFSTWHMQHIQAKHSREEHQQEKKSEEARFHGVQILAQTLSLLKLSMLSLQISLCVWHELPLLEK